MVPSVLEGFLRRVPERSASMIQPSPARQRLWLTRSRQADNRTGILGPQPFHDGAPLGDALHTGGVSETGTHSWSSYLMKPHADDHRERDDPPGQPYVVEC